MRVRVKLHAALRKHLKADQWDGFDLELHEGATVGDVIAQIGIPPKHAGMLVSGDEYLEATSVLQDGQELNVFPPMAGGTSSGTCRRGALAQCRGGGGVDHGGTDERIAGSRSEGWRTNG